MIHLFVGIDPKAKSEDGWFSKNYRLGKSSMLGGRWAVGVKAVVDVVRSGISALGQIRRTGRV